MSESESGQGSQDMSFDCPIMSFDIVHLSVANSQIYLTQVLVVSLFLSLYIQQTVAFPQPGHALGAHRHLAGLTVLHQCKANATAARCVARGSWQSLFTRRAYKGKEDRKMLTSILCDV